MRHAGVVSLVATLFLVSPLRSEEWPGWRGPRLDGSSRETNVPLRWTAQENIAWKAPLAGIGHSSPVVYGDQVFVTACVLKTNERLLSAYDRRNGKELWSKVVVTSPLEPKHGLNSYASSTPATDGKHVYVNFARLRPQVAGEHYPIKPRHSRMRRSSSCTLAG